MSEESRIGDLREREGYKASKKGQPLHEGASSEFTKGYRFGGKIVPAKFDKGGSEETWTCIGCQHENSSKRRWMKGNVELCWNCGVEREYVDEEKIDGRSDS
jgi:hypothetical protein